MTDTFAHWGFVDPTEFVNFDDIDSETVGMPPDAYDVGAVTDVEAGDADV